MPSFMAPDYVHLRMAPNESQMQLINMNGEEQSATSTSSSPCFNESSESPYVPTTEPSITVPNIGYRSGKGSIIWWRARTTLEKLLFIALFIFLIVGIILLVLVFQFSGEANLAKEQLAAITSSATSSPSTSTSDLSPSTTPALPSPTTTESHEFKVCDTAGCVKAANYFLDAMDPKVDPCDNFFEYACGKWNHDHPIPDDSPVFGTFALVRDIVRQQMRVSLENADRTYDSKAINDARLSYKICMDTKHPETAKSQPLLDELSNVEGLNGWPLLTLASNSTSKWNASTFDLTRAVASTRNEIAIEMLFTTFVYADSKNTTKNILIVDQGSLTLGRGSRDYYLNRTHFATQIAALKKYMYQVTEILVHDANVDVNAEINATVDAILDFETKLAEIISPEEIRRNSTRQYNIRKISDLYDLLPEVEWITYFKFIAPESVHDLLTNDTEINISELEYMTKLSTLLKSTDSRVVADYISWRIIAASVKYLDDRFEDVRHELTRALTGQSQRSPRWKECTMVPSVFFPHAAGAIYVGEHFDSNDRLEAVKMIANLRQAFKEIVTESEWMDQETKEYAILKVDSMVQLIGYPDFIKNNTLLDEKYAGLKILPEDTYFTMVKKVSKFNNEKDFVKLRKPFDKLEFDTSPAVVNAFYSAERNSITFPAGILQPPFFAGTFPMSVNYGAIGAVIGHEITHGFDDQGSQFDKDGNLRNWWNGESANGFESRKECMIDQYSSYHVSGINLTVNGRLTLGENIADNGGVKEAYRAFQSHASPEDKRLRLPGLQHLSAEQLFFLSYANFWCGHKTKEHAQQQVLQDEHSPEIFRVIGVLSNFDEFSKAYSCASGSKLNPEKKCQVW